MSNENQTDDKELSTKDTTPHSGSDSRDKELPVADIEVWRRRFKLIVFTRQIFDKLNGYVLDKQGWSSVCHFFFYLTSLVMLYGLCLYGFSFVGLELYYDQIQDV